jgi:hypothetical protein
MFKDGRRIGLKRAAALRLTPFYEPSTNGERPWDVVRQNQYAGRDTFDSTTNNAAVKVVNHV